MNFSAACRLAIFLSLTFDIFTVFVFSCLQFEFSDMPTEEYTKISAA